MLEHFQTDTADYADILLPATTQLEHLDLHRSYGHTYAMLNARHFPLGESKPNTEIFRLLAERMGLRTIVFGTGRRHDAAGAHRFERRRLLEELQENGWKSLQVGDAPFAQGGFPTLLREMDSIRTASMS